MQFFCVQNWNRALKTKLHDSSALINEEHALYRVTFYKFMALLLVSHNLLSGFINILFFCASKDELSDFYLESKGSLITVYLLPLYINNFWLKCCLHLPL